MDTKIYVEPGDFFEITLPWSEVCMHMRVADERFTAELTTGPYPAVQLWKGEHHFSGPVTTGEAGLYSDNRGFYGYGITDIRRPGVGAHDCPCCSDITYSDTLLCSECREAGCEQTTDASGEPGWWDCSRTDTDEHEHEVAVIYSIPDRVMGATLVRGAQVTECSCGQRLSYEPRS